MRLLQTVTPRSRGGLHEGNRGHLARRARKLAVEAADNGLLVPELADGITRVKGVAAKWCPPWELAHGEAGARLLNVPDATTNKGLRDRAHPRGAPGMPPSFRGSGLTFKHVQQRDGRWCIVDLVGKNGRVRTAPMPTWVNAAIDRWLGRGGNQRGCVFRPVDKGGSVRRDKMADAGAYAILKRYS